MKGAAGVGSVASWRAASALSDFSVESPAIVSAPADRVGPQIQLNPPPPPPPPVHWDPGDFVRGVQSTDRSMAFTFDDGPSPSNTYSVLRALALYNVKATFFLVGVNVRAYPQIARDIVSEGHELGNHNNYHTPYRSSSLASQIPGNNDIIQSETGVRPVAKRAPGLTKGSLILSVCRSQGMYEVHTRMSTSDYVSPRWSAWRLATHFSSNLVSGANPIYHDGGGRRPTRDAVASMVNIAASRGYRCETVTDLANSGVPLPGRSDYGFLQLPSEDGADDGLFAEPLTGDCCRFDVRGGLLERLEEPGVSAAERSRIVEQLAMLNDHARKHAD